MRPSVSVTATACLLALACTTAHAAPPPYSNLIVFGDSLNDAGQFPDAGGPLGSSLRFTNRIGPTYLSNNKEPIAQVSSTLLGTRLGMTATQLAPSTTLLAGQHGKVDGSNWATGGYTTSQILASITADSIISGDNNVVLRQRPGYLRSNAMKADQHALYLLEGGANDFFQGLVTSPATAAAAANRLVDSARALQQAGARYLLVWLLPDVGLTPLNYGTAAQAPSSLLSAAFNQQLINQLAQVPAEIIPINVPRLFNEIIASPSSFGLISGTPLLTTCFSGVECTANPQYGIGGTMPNPNKLLFNDSVHPTSAGQKIIADYAYSLLAAPWELTLLPQMAKATLQSQEDSLRQQWQADNGAWQAPGKWRAIINGGAQRLDFDAQKRAVDADSRHASLQVGGSYRLDPDWRLGVLGGAYRQSLKAGQDDSRYKLDSYLGSAFAQFQHDRWWADAAFTAGRLDYRDLQRTFTLGINERAEQGNTLGSLWAGSSRLGFNLLPSTSIWQVSPFVSAAYARINVDGYREKGERSTALQVDKQTLTSKRLGAGMQASVQPLPGTRVFAEVAHEHEFNSDPQTLTMNQKSLPTLDYRLGGYRPAQELDRMTVGLKQHLTRDLALSASYNLSKTDDLSQQGINLGLSLDF